MENDSVDRKRDPTKWKMIKASKINLHQFVFEYFVTFFKCDDGSTILSVFSKGLN